MSYSNKLWKINLTNDIVAILEVRAIALFRNRDIKLRNLLFLEFIHYFDIWFHRLIAQF